MAFHNCGNVPFYLAVEIHKHLVIYDQGRIYVPDMIEQVMLHIPMYECMYVCMYTCIHVLCFLQIWYSLHTYTDVTFMV